MTLELETRNDPTRPTTTLTTPRAPLMRFAPAADEHRAAMDERIATETRALNERIATLETRLSRPHAQPRNPNEPSAERRALVEYLRHGDRANPSELRSLIVSSDPSGGYFTPPEISSEFIRELVLISPIRPLASVRTTASEVVTYPTRTGITNAVWKGETQPMTESQPAFGQTDINIREINTFVDISKTCLPTRPASRTAKSPWRLLRTLARKKPYPSSRGRVRFSLKAIWSTPPSDIRRPAMRPRSRPVRPCPTS